jgi:hypothetical protein
MAVRLPILVLALAAAGSAFAQQVPTGVVRPAGADVTPLKEIQEIARPWCDFGNDSACAIQSRAEHLARGLREGWPPWPGAAPIPPRPLPADYSDSLRSLLKTLRVATDPARSGVLPVKLPADTQAAFDFVKRDLDAKDKDCLQFGMGRLVPVSVRTVRSDRSADPGWELFYTCSFGGLTGGESRAPGLTHTTLSLPPAASCTFHVRRTGRDAQAGPVPVAGTPAVTVEIVVP